MEIEKGIPIPIKRSELFRSMERGDSILFKPQTEGEWPSIRSACITYSIDGVKFIARRVDDGLRVWRVA
jgi:hypothetical protein